MPDTKNSNQILHKHPTYRKSSHYLGAAAGVVLETSLHPLDTIAKRLQSSPLQSSSSLTQLKTSTGEMSNILHPSTTSTLMAGFFAALTYRAVQRTIMFGTQPILKAKIEGVCGDRIEGFVGAKYRSMMAHTVSGALIGLTEVVVLPLDTWKVRRQLGHTDNFAKLISDIGFGAYRGATVTGLRNIKAFSTMYLTDGLVKMHLFNLHSNDPISFQQRLISSFSGSIAAVIVSNPLDTIKTRVQNKQGTAMQVAKEIYNKNGAKGFIKGLTPRLFAVAPKLTLIKSASEHLTPLIDSAIDVAVKKSQRRK